MFSEAFPNVFGLILDVLVVLLGLYTVFIGIYVVFIRPKTRPIFEKDAQILFNQLITDIFDDAISVIKCYFKEGSIPVKNNKDCFILLRSTHCIVCPCDQYGNLSDGGGRIYYENILAFYLKPVSNFPITPTQKLDYIKDSKQIESFYFVLKVTEKQYGLFHFTIDNDFDFDKTFNNLAFAEPNFFAELEKHVPYLSYKEFDQIKKTYNISQNNN